MKQTIKAFVFCIICFFIAVGLPLVLVSICVYPKSELFFDRMLIQVSERWLL